MACCGTGFSAGKFIAAIVAVGVGGYVAFNYATTGTLCGSCGTPADAKTVQTVGAADGAFEPCPMSGCDMGSGVTEVAAAGKSCCAGSPADCAGSPEDCAGPNEDCQPGACPMSGAQIQEASTTAPATGPCGKPCEEACDQPCGACPQGACPHQEEIASNKPAKSDG